MPSLESAGAPRCAPPKAARIGHGRGLRAFVRGERGAAAVEFAILLPVLCAILLGMIDYGFYFFLNSTAVNAAREGARAGVVITTNATDVETEAASVATSYLNGANISLGSCTNCASVSAAVVGGTNLQVTVSIDPYQPLTGFLPAGALPARATHTSIMRLEGLLP